MLDQGRILILRYYGKLEICITWLPYYQTQHLQVIESYLDLFSINDISKLPTGKGKPPQEDAQIFLEAILSDPLHFIPSSSYLNPPFSSLFSLPTLLISPYLPLTFVTDTATYNIDNMFLLTEDHHLMPPSIHHQQFT